MARAKDELTPSEELWVRTMTTIMFAGLDDPRIPAAIGRLARRFAIDEAKPAAEKPAQRRKGRA